MSAPVPNGAGGASTTAQFDRSEFIFLPSIVEILQRIQSGRDASEVSKMVMNFYDQINACRQQIMRLPGLELSPADQQRAIDAAIAHVQLRKQQLEAFSQLPVFAAATVASLDSAQLESVAIKQEPADDPMDTS